jgi:hypothetical protein
MTENPSFSGIVSFVTHSLGSIITYDLLANQERAKDSSLPPYPNRSTHFEIVYPKLKVIPKFQFSLGSPLGAVLVMRGQSFAEYQLPATRFYNLFNLYDPFVLFF